MLDFNKYVMRHGEAWVQEIIERIERHEGIKYPHPITLELRWQVLMQLPVSSSVAA